MVNAKKRSYSTGVDSSGSRVSTRSQSIRKSNRLEGRSPPITSLKKKSLNSAALRRSPGLNKRNGGGSSGGLKKCGSESGGGEKTTAEATATATAKRLDARRYRDMFKPLKNVEGSGGKEVKEEESGGDGEEEEEEEKVEDVNDNCGGDGEEEEKEKVEDGKEDCGGDLNDDGAPMSGDVVEKVEDAEPVSSSSGVVDLDEECDQCSRKRSLDHDSQEQELCCCLPNPVNDMDGYMDRGQGGGCAAEFSKEHGQNGKQCNSSFDIQGRICGACQCAGELLHCGGKGCRRSYHPSCLSSHEKIFSLSNWYCSECTKKRFLFGVHSVSQGIESILDVREVELSTEGKPKQKQYYVKYKGLAHIHNRWIPEIQVLHVVPELHAMVGKLKEDTQWNPVWTVPHRLLQRRSVIIDDPHGKPTEQEVSLESVSQYEWLVKWCGLDYDQATWELEDSSFLKKLEAQRLIKEYETRHNKARATSISLNNEVQEKRKVSHTKMGRHSIGGVDNSYHYFINKLRECHHRGHNAVLLDEQDRFVKLIHLVSSLAASVCRPFLFITPHASFSSWEAEFTCLAPSINVVVYAGNEDARDIIRSVEFFEGDHLMLQVLISSAAAITEDADRLRGIEWEAIIIDDCQQSCILAHSDSIMNLATGWRLLLVNSHLEDNISEYINILCLLEPGCSFKEHPEVASNSNETMNLLKEKLSPFIICARFLEYWVPVEMSNLQLEQYCFSLLSKSSVLRSISKSDPVGSLREILILLRKCCDHPYIVDMQLQNSLAYGLSYEAVMDLGIKASGKLHLLEKLLSELKNKERKVLILFQPAGGSGRDSTGNILDDFLRFRFGSDSYEHIESGLISSKKQTACNQFNSVKDRSFLLLETRACSPSIKLAFVDAVIIFDSDWNPLNDLRALQKITIDSKLDQIKIFRLYCPGTVEEKVLILAKNDVVLDNTLQIISPSTSHMLLMWGSSYLFSRLDEFHQNSNSDCKDNIVFESSLSMDVIQEIVSLFQNRKISSSNKYISIAQQNGGSYSKSIALIGEQRILSDEGEAPHVFWPRLLEGLKPQWKYLSGSSQRNRKRVQYYDELTSVQNDEATKRRKKTDSTKPDSSSLQAEPRPETPIINSQSKGNTDPNSHKGNDSVIAEPYNLKKLHSEQRGLFELLKPTVLQLCEALLLKDDGKRLVERFLGYLVKNYRVTKEPETRLQAFLLSVCWTAVEGLKQKVDHKMSATIVREKLGFVCTENETEDIYTKLKPIFSCSGIMNHPSAGDLSSGKGEESFEKVKKRVEKGCDKKMKRLKNKHDEELKEFEKSWEDERMKLESWCKLESAGIRVSHANSSVGTDLLRALDNDYAKKRDDLEKKISMHLKELEARQKIEREEEQEKIAGLMERLNSLGHNSRGKNGVNSQLPDPVEPDKESNEHTSNNGNLLEQQNSEREASRTTGAATNLIASENLENMEKQRANCEIDHSLENIAASKGSGIIMGPPEQPLINASENIAASEGSGIILPPEQLLINASENIATSSILGPPEQPASENVAASKETGIIMEPPEQPCASTGQVNQDTNLMIDVVKENSICLPSNQLNEAQIMESSTNLLPDDVIQALGTETHIGVEERVSDATCTNNNSSLDESSPLNRSDHVESSIPHTGVMSNSTHCSMNEWVNNNRVADSSLVSQPNENDTSIGAATTPMHQYHTSSSTSGVTFSQSHPQMAIDQSVDTNLVPIGVVSSHANLQSQVQAPITSVPQAHTSLPDPLQMELERLHHEIVKVMNHHEGTKSQLKSECDKEIEELVAQIKKKYEKQLNEAETSFSLKKTELEMCQHKVMMNKILAEAFRSKCTDYKAAPKTQQQGISSSSAGSSSRSHHTRPVSASGPLSTMPASGPFNAAPPVPRVGPAMSLATQSRMARINFGGAPMATQQQQVRHEAHASASFIQASRSSTPNFSSNVPSGSVPIVPVQNNPMSTSALHLPSHTSQLPSSAQLNPHGRSHHEGSAGRGTPHSHLSNTELLRDITRGNTNDRQYSSNVPLFLDILASSQSWDLSQFEEVTNLQPPSSNLAAGDVVCLSDDE